MDKEDELRSNIFDHPMAQIEYVDLTSIISFDDFDPEQYRVDEVRVLEPRLRELGWKVGHWQDAGINYLACSSGRTCKATNTDGYIQWFIYE